MTPTDAELVAAIRRGDAAAADALVRRHYRAGFATALAVLGESMDAEDACQDAFVRALDRIEDCRTPERFVYWLMSIVRNHALNLHARRRVRGGPAVEDVDPPARGDASGRAETGELRARLEAALGRLTVVQREVILLKHLEGWEHRQIAEALGISEGMSRQHAFEGRRVLRERLGPGALEDHLDA
jgi:RNA polymerase sigma-70 factor, ECF subfamily